MTLAIVDCERHVLCGQGLVIRLALEAANLGQLQAFAFFH